jgi:hypothetical protein
MKHKQAKKIETCGGEFEQNNKTVTGSEDCTRVETVEIHNIVFPR